MIERELIHRRVEAGLPGPHTKNERLRDYWFPNIRRTDGRLFKWWHSHIAGADMDPPKKIYATLACWMIARLSTLKEIEHLLITHGWDSQLVLNHFQGRPALISVMTPGVLPRTMTGVCSVMESASARALEYQLGPELRHNTYALAQVKGIGMQLAFEVACAMRYLEFGTFEPYVYAGKSTVKGTGALLGLELNPDSMYGRDAAKGVVGRLMEEAGGAFGWQHADAQKALELFHYYARPTVPLRRYRCK